MCFFSPPGGGVKAPRRGMGRAGLWRGYLHELRMQAAALEEVPVQLADHLGGLLRPPGGGGGHEATGTRRWGR